jgi:hypothetical protein
LLVAIVGQGVLARVRYAGRIFEPLSAVLLLATGGYVVYYSLSAGASSAEAQSASACPFPGQSSSLVAARLLAQHRNPIRLPRAR